MGRWALASTSVSGGTAPTPIPSPVSGSWFFPVSTHLTAVNAALGNNVLRLVPWWLDAPVSLSALGTEITAAGQAGAVLRLTIYGDSGAKPGALVVDAGTVAADASAVVSTAISVNLARGLYWIGGVLQNAATTQPGVRATGSYNPPVPVQASTGATLPASAFANMGWLVNNVTGAAPSTLVAVTAFTSFNAPRLFAKVA